MADTVIRNVYIALITFALLITGGIFVLTETLSSNDLPIDADLGPEYTAFNNSLNSFTIAFEDSAQEAPKGTFQTITDFFTRGIKIVTVFLQSPAVAFQAVQFVQASWGFSAIPAVLWVFIAAIITAIILFTVISAYLRNKT